MSEPGSIDYSKLLTAIEDELNVVIPEAMIEKHRKEGTSYFRVSVTETESKESVEEPHTDSSNAVEAKPESQTETESKKESVEVKQDEPELIMPLPADNFFEKSSTNIYF